MNKEHLEYVAKGKTISAKATRAGKLLAKGEIVSFTVWGETDNEGSQVKIFYSESEQRFYSLTTTCKKNKINTVEHIYSKLCSSLHDLENHGIELHYSRSVADTIARHICSTGKFNY